MAEFIDNTYEGSVYQVKRVRSGIITMTDKGTISAYDGERYEHIPGLAEVRMAQTVHALTYLTRLGVPTSFIKAEDATTIQCVEAHLFPLEVVVRKALIGSHLKRYPEAKPRWLPSKEVLVEFFHKQTFDARVGKLVDGNSLRQLGSAEIKRLKAEKKVFPDPFIVPGDHQWQVYDAAAPMEKQKKALLSIPPLLTREQRDKVAHMAAFAVKVLGKAFEHVNCNRLGIPDCTALRMADIKFEFGIAPWGDIILCDVVNLDGMRLIINGKLGPNMRHLSKQVFRDGGSKAEVLKVYQQGLKAFEQFDGYTPKTRVPLRG